MRTYPSRNDKQEKEDLKAEEWMFDALKMNPSYVFWGPHEDYMMKLTDEEAEKHNQECISKFGYSMKAQGHGWESRAIIDTWKQFADKWSLDEMNEVVNFYFIVERDSRKCETCDQTGLNAESKIISDNFYPHSSYPNKLVKEGWSKHDITPDEIEELVKAGRLVELVEPRCYFDESKKQWITWDGDKRITMKNPPAMPTPEQVNVWNTKMFGHDAINRWILIEQRATRLGVYGHCSECGGSGHIYTEPAGKLGLVLWVLHPRKGCSRGVHIRKLERSDVNEAVKFLRKADARNRKRFSKLKLVKQESEAV